jgi:hypothetical protein
LGFSDGVWNIGSGVDFEKIDPKYIKYHKEEIKGHLLPYKKNFEELIVII